MAKLPSSKSNKPASQSVSSYWQNLESEVSNNQSKISMILGSLIIFVVVLLIFNFFNKNKSSLGPAQTTESTSEQQDVSPENLPGKYTVKEGNTLFLIAEKYYSDGYKFTEIAKANNISDVNAITVGQTLEIPKLEAVEVAESTPAPITIPAGTPEVSASDYGPAITANTYTVVEGDWLSTIAARAYGDIFAYPKIAQANNITNPDYITPGMVLTIPR